jgi:hypothetical protein
MVYGTLRSHSHRETRRNTHVKQNTEMNKASKLVIGGITIVRVGNEIRYSIPEDMTGKKLGEIKSKYHEAIKNYTENSRNEL